MPAELRHGSTGEAVRDLQARLGALGHNIAPDDPGGFADGTELAVRVFQAARGLRVDGAVGQETWAVLVESGFTLGDRLLYLHQPLLRGDDVAALQHRLNALGFDAGREDGLLGQESADALAEFQRASGLRPDGICGPATVASLRRVGSFADSSAASIRERERLLAGPRGIAGRRVYVAVAPGLAVLGEEVAKRLADAGAAAVLDASGEDDALLADKANRFDAHLFVAIRTGDAACRCAYFATGDFRSEEGIAVATAIHTELAPILPTDAGVCGKAYTALRETRMTAVVCDLVPDDDVEAMRALVTRAGDTGRAIVRGIQHAGEHPTPDV